MQRWIAYAIEGEKFVIKVRQFPDRFDLNKIAGITQVQLPEQFYLAFVSLLFHVNLYV